MWGIAEWPGIQRGEVLFPVFSYRRFVGRELYVGMCFSPGKGAPAALTTSYAIA